MNVDSIRKHCLSFQGASENLQWGADLCFKVSGKIFAILSLESIPPGICFKCSPEKFAELCEQEAIGPAPYVGRYKWVLVEGLDVLDSSEMKALIRQSYELVSAKLPHRAKARSSPRGRPKKRERA
jgi:predicted DNA-binding protein (MmcQ/YjbR family)